MFGRAPPKKVGSGFSLQSFFRSSKKDFHFNPSRNQLDNKINPDTKPLIFYLGLKTSLVEVFTISSLFNFIFRNFPAL
jgi:hypothetical protein